MNWSRTLDFSPLETPDGETLATLADARDYLLAMEESPETHEAAGMLLKAAELGGPFRFFARQATRRAIEAAQKTKRPRRGHPARPGRSGG